MTLYHNAKVSKQASGISGELRTYYITAQDKGGGGGGGGGGAPPPPPPPPTFVPPRFICWRVYEDEKIVCYDKFSIAHSYTQNRKIVCWLKGIVQPFELGGVTSLIQSAVSFCKAGHFQKKFLMIQSHERSLKQNSAA